MLTTLHTARTRKRARRNPKFLRLFDILELRVLLSAVFGAPTGHLTNPPPLQIAAGDFNGDGLVDLASIAGTGSSSVSVLRNTGNGTFSAVTNYGVGTNPVSIATADFNGDGRTDIAVANAGSNSVSLLESNAAGDFAPKVNFPLRYSDGGHPVKIIAADVNGDGLPDLVVGNNANTLSVLLNLGHGTFAAPANISAPNGASEIVAGDFNGDGKLDLVYGGATTNLDVSLGNGSGTFVAPTVLAVGNFSFSVTAADFNNDGKSDIALLQSGNLLNVELNNGNGTFSSATYATGSIPESIAVADFDGDGKLDIAVANIADSTVSIFHNLGGTFAPKQDFDSGEFPNWVITADFNADGKPDLAFAESESLHDLYPSINVVPNLTVASNDNFASAADLGSAVVTVKGSNSLATKEAGEPKHANNSGGHSIWYDWTAPATGNFVIDTLGSNFDTLLGVYVGSSVSTLSTVAYNNNFGVNTFSRVSIAANSGAVYAIAVDGANGESGAVVLNINPGVTPISGNAPSFFDSSYYLAHNPDVAAAIVHGEFPDAFSHFITFGQYEGRQPSADFNERYYLAANPDVAAAVDAGTYKTGFQQFVAHGFAQGRAGIGAARTAIRVSGNAQSFFDPVFYLANNPDVLNAVRNGAFASAWSHFILFGQYEGRQPSAQFDERFYLRANPAVALAVNSGVFQTGFQQFVLYGFSEGRSGTGFYNFTPTSGNAQTFFDPTYYLLHNHDVLRAVRSGAISAWEHFLLYGQFEGRNPSALFNEADYLAAYPDVRAAVAAGDFKDGFQHFVLYGYAEGRSGI